MPSRAINKGSVSRFFIKPCNSIDLAVTIRQALEQKDLMAHARRLLQRVENQSAVLETIEKNNPGITHVERDVGGAIVLENCHEDFETFMKRINSALNKTPDNQSDTTK